MIRFCLIALSLFSIFGCGDGGPVLCSVKGNVTKGGMPLKGVNVTFSPVEAGPSSGGITNAEGNFILLCQSGKAGAVAGKHKAVLSMVASADASPVGFEAMMAARKSSESKGERGAPAKSEDTASFPSEYGDARTTPLSYEIKPGNNEFDVVIP